MVQIQGNSMFWKRKRDPNERPVGPHVKFTKYGSAYVEDKDFFSDPRFKKVMKYLDDKLIEERKAEQEANDKKH